VYGCAQSKIQHYAKEDTTQLPVRPSTVDFIHLSSENRILKRDLRSSQATISTYLTCFALMGDAGILPGQWDVDSKGVQNPLQSSAAHTPQRKLKIVTVGAGFSGLIFAHKLQHERPEFQQLVSHKIFELRDDIGGTWLVNRYPGVQCDVPAHVYVCFLVCLCFCH
jgi:hypothetical protein